MSNQEGKKWFYPASEVEEARVAKPGELIVESTLKPYVGVYCRARGHILSGPRPTPQSLVLIPAVDKHKNINTIKYFELTGIERDNHSTPLMHIPKPDEETYELGQFQRYFVQKINEPNKIYEIDDKQFKDWNVENKNGPDGKLYEKFEIQWMLKGRDAVTINRSNIDYRETQNPGIKYFLADARQFVRGSQGQERYYEDGTKISTKLPAAYGESPKLNQLCGNCKFFNNGYCGRWQANVRIKLWCKSWAEIGTYGIPAAPVGQYYLFENGNGTVYYDNGFDEPIAFSNEDEFFTHRTDNGYPADWTGIAVKPMSESSTL